MIRTTENNIPNNKALTKGQLKFLNEAKSLLHLQWLNTARPAYCKSKRQKLTKSSPTAISQELQMKNKMYAITTAGTRLTLILILWQSEVEKESTFWALNECK